MEGYLSNNELIDSLGLTPKVIEHVGDCTNLERKVNTNSYLWETLVVCRGLTLQQSRISRLFRIVDHNGVQKANGSLSAMKEKMARLLSKDFLRPGDVIGVSRGAYEHYGVYLGDRRVIHYAGEEADFKGRVTIHEAPFEEFLKKNKDYFVVSFEGKYPIRIQSSTRFISQGYINCMNIRCDEVYSPEETLNRAYSRLGEAKYSLINNNCEHFAFWCKSGRAESCQVKQMIQFILTTGIGIGSVTDKKADLIKYLSA